jgi:hypothetical protein
MGRIVAILAVLAGTGVLALRVDAEDLRDQFTNQMPYTLRTPIVRLGLPIWPKFQRIQFTRDAFGERHTFMMRDGHCEVLEFASWRTIGEYRPLDGYAEPCFREEIRITNLHWWNPLARK